MFINKSLLIFLNLLNIQLILSLTSEYKSKWKDSMLKNKCKETQLPLVEYYDENGLEYLFFSQRVTWEEAQMLCNSYNSRLAVLNTLEKSVQVAQSLAESNIVTDDAWIGARRIDFVWYWINNDLRSWENAMSSEPNVEDFPPWSREPTRPTRECLAIGRRSHKNPNFIDLDCRLLKPFICEKKTEVLVSNPIPIKWIKINNNIYTLYNGKLTWQEAVTFCRAKGARLAIVKNLITTHILANIMTKTRPDFEKMWIGAHFSYGQWVWLPTGTILSSLTDESGYPPWRFGRPDINDGCLVLDRHIDHNSTFIVMACDHKRDFICEQYPEDEISDWWNEPVKFSFENDTYMIYPTDKNWQESREFCNDRGSVLAHIEQKDVINLMINAMSDHPRAISHIWLGGKYDYKTDEWFWIDTTINNDNKTIERNKDEHGFPPWIELEGEKSVDRSNISYCLNLDRVDNVKPFYYGLDCDNKQPFVCQISCNIPPVVNNGNWNCSQRPMTETGRQCQLQCNQSFIMMGMNNISCSPQNGWTVGVMNFMEFPLCLKPLDYSLKMTRSLAKDIQKSSAYYILLYHSSAIMKSNGLKFVEWILNAFPTSNHLKMGMITYLTNSPTYLPLNQTNSCAVINAIRHLKNFPSNGEKIVAPNIARVYEEISSYDGRIISIIAVIDSTAAQQYKKVLLDFKAAGHHITIIGLRKDLNTLLPLASIGFDGRHNLFLFEEDEFPKLVNQMELGKKSRCQNLPYNLTAPLYHDILTVINPTTLGPDLPINNNNNNNNNKKLGYTSVPVVWTSPTQFAMSSEIISTTEAFREQTEAIDYEYNDKTTKTNT